MTHIRTANWSGVDPRDDDRVKRAWRAGSFRMRPEELAVFRATTLVEVKTKAGTRLVVQRPPRASGTRGRP